MNFNYDLVTLIDYFIGAFICCLGGLLIGKILLKKKFSDISKIKLLLLIPFAIFTIFNTLAFDNILKIFGVLILDVLIYKYILEEKSIKVFIYAFVTIIILSLAEIFFIFLISVSDYLFRYHIANTISKAIYSNTIIIIFACLITYSVRNKLIVYINKLDKANVLIILIQFILTIFIILSSINYLYIEKWKFSYRLILIFIIIFGSATTAFSLMKQYLKNKEVVSKHQMLEEYLKTSADLIEKYSSTVHKYKNNLIVIKGYLKSKNINETEKYVDGLLDNMKNQHYSWVSKINYISIDTIRYMIYYKLSKAEELNLNILVNVSNNIKEIEKHLLKSNELGHILDILGELFDNAIYASDESETKELIFDLYMENNKIYVEIANTYKGQIDLNLITKNGYTTKGKGHGFGLYDVDHSIKNVNILENKYELIDKYFFATLIITLPNEV